MTESKLKPRPIYWFALFLLVTSVCINYADRGNLGVAATRLQSELHLDGRGIGILMSVFSITYALAQIGGAKIIDRWNVNWLYAIAFFLWSGATGATGLANVFWQFVLLRLLLGVSESLAYPAYAKMMVVSFPESLRGTANGLIDAGSKLGPAVGSYVGFLILDKYDWRGMFLIIGAASMIWLVPWCAVAGKLPHKVLQAKSTEIVQAMSYGTLMKNRVFWGLPSDFLVGIMPGISCSIGCPYTKSGTTLERICATSPLFAIWLSPSRPVRSGLLRIGSSGAATTPAKSGK